MTDSKEEIKKIDNLLKERLNWQYPYSTALTRMKEKLKQIE